MISRYVRLGGRTSDNRGFSSWTEKQALEQSNIPSVLEGTTCWGVNMSSLWQRVKIIAIILGIAILVLGIAILAWLLLPDIAGWVAYSHFFRTLTTDGGLNAWLARAVSTVLLVFFVCGVRMVLS